MGIELLVDGYLAVMLLEDIQQVDVDDLWME